MDCRVKPGNDEGGPSPQIQFLEKVIALAADDAKAGEILDRGAPDRFHAELRPAIYVDHLAIFSADRFSAAFFEHSEYDATIASKGRVGGR
jgi:hypothetical protein